MPPKKFNVVISDENDDERRLEGILHEKKGAGRPKDSSATFDAIVIGVDAKNNMLKIHAAGQPENCNAYIVEMGKVFSLLENRKIEEPRVDMREAEFVMDQERIVRITINLRTMQITKMAPKSLTFYDDDDDE